MDEFYARLGALIRDKRRANSITQERLAERLGLSRTTVVNIEKGRQRIAVHQLVDLSDVLGCEPVELLPTGVDEGVATNDREQFAAQVARSAERGTK